MLVVDCVVVIAVVTCDDDVGEIVDAAVVTRSEVVDGELAVCVTVLVVVVGVIVEVVLEVVVGVVAAVVVVVVGVVVVVVYKRTGRRR